MDTYILPHDIKTMYVTATSFPAGVMNAHNELHALLPTQNRKVFGLSRPEGVKGIVYKAAAEEAHPGEAEQLGLETFIIKKGTYTSSYIADFMKDLPAIGNTFQQLLANPGIDPNGCCIEWYVNDKDVRCMVRLER